MKKNRLLKNPINKIKVVTLGLLTLIINKSKIATLMFVIAISVVACSNDDNGKSPLEYEGKLIGKLITVPNPCLTVPCLPGLVAAIETDSLSYIITVDNLWFWNEVIIDDDSLSLNESFELFGIISKRQDIYLNNFYEIEILNFKKL